MNKENRIAAFLLMLILSASLARSVKAQDGTASQPSRTNGNNVTILYDVTLHEFTCWGNGRRDYSPHHIDLMAWNARWDKIVKEVSEAYRAQPGDCGQGTGFYPYKDNVFFFDDQTVWIQLIGAHLGDLFTVQAPNTALTEPTIPIFGQTSTLPSFSQLGTSQQAAATAASTVAQALSEVFGQAPPPTPPSVVYGSYADQLYANIDQSTFKSVLQGIVSSFAPPTTTAPSQLPIQILSQPIGPAIRYFSYDPVITKLKARVASLEAQVKNLNLGDTCEPSLQNPTSRNAADLLSAITYLTHITESENALYQQLTAGQYTNFSQTLVTALATINSVAQPATDIANQARSFNAFQSVIDKAFKGDPTAVGQAINNVIRDRQSKQYIVSSPGYPDFDALLKQINALSLAGTNKTDATAKILANNLRILLAQRANIDAIATALQQLATETNGVVQAAKSSLDIQSQLNQLGELTVAAAHLANCRLEKVALPHPYDYFSLGTWYSSQTVNVTLTQSSRVPPFNLSSVNPFGVATTQPPTGTAPSPAPAASTPGSANPTATTGMNPSNPAGTAPPSSPPNSGSSPQSNSGPAPQTATSSVARQTMFAIHGRYHWLLGGGIAFGRITHYNYTLFTQTPTTVPSPGSLPACAAVMDCLFIQQNKLKWEVFPTLDVVYLFKPQDPFPYSFRGKPGESVPHLANGIDAGFDIADPGQNFVLSWITMFRARNSTVLNGVGFKIGMMVGQTQYVALPNVPGAGFNQYFQPPSPDTVTASQKWNYGVTAGFTVSAITFQDIFGAIFK